MPGSCLEECFAEISTVFIMWIHLFKCSFIQQMSSDHISDIVLVLKDTMMGIVDMDRTHVF